MTIHGRCHCGNIRYQLRWPDEAIPARACGCTFCVKHRGVWTAHAEAVLLVQVADREQVSPYAFGTETATFHVCRRCGVVPVVTSEIDGTLYAVVNVHAFEDVAPSRLTTAPVDFDGEDRAARLARRQQHWIADVRIETDG